jgi:hypothetical protein
MPFDARQGVFFRPPPVAVHDDGHMAWQVGFQTVFLQKLGIGDHEEGLADRQTIDVMHFREPQKT